LAGDDSRPTLTGSHLAKLEHHRHPHEVTPPAVRNAASRERLAAMSYRHALAVVATFQSTADAEIAKGVLAAVGVDALIRADNAGGMYPALIPTELLVRTDDVARARDALARAAQASD
jgi:hypothetical protein